MNLSDIDDSDTSLQFKFSSNFKDLRTSLNEQGQDVPIGLTAARHGKGYRIIDGFCRVAAAKALGWSAIQAQIFPAMSERDLRRLAVSLNVKRRNLSGFERANAMHLMRRESYDIGQIADIFDLSARTVERALELPSHILKVIDGRVLTMAHAKVLRDADERMVGGLKAVAVEELAEEVRFRKLTAAQLKKHLAARLAPAGRSRRFARSDAAGTVRLYAAKLGPNSRRSDLEQAKQSLADALQVVEKLLDDSSPEVPGPKRNRQ